MNGRFLLDTNIVIAVFAQDVLVQRGLGEAAEVYLPTIVLGELYYGAHRSAHAKSNVARIYELAGSTAVLGCDIETARQYGQIKQALRAKGRPLPENDMWIAAIARQHGLTLVSRDEHFRGITDLLVEMW